MCDSAAEDQADQRWACPVCVVLRAIDDIQPEVRTHLAAAGRELVLALRAAVVEPEPGPRASTDDVWSDDRCGRSAGESAHDDRAHQHPSSPAPLRRIAVQ